ncbi:MAG: hypothetical protein JSS29_12930 [Proteobacteria bacterium]|nr:hypothetical protein [Pseudomonadota bacterium]
MRALTLLLVLAGLGFLAWSHWHQEPQLRSDAKLIPPTTAASRARVRPATPSAAVTPAATNLADVTPEQFVKRLHCSQYHFLLGNRVSADVFALLCAGQLAKAGQRLLSLARSGDRTAVASLGMLAQCDRGDAPRPVGRRERGVELARRYGASDQTIARLDAVLAEEERGPSAERKEQCAEAQEMTQAAMELWRQDVEKVLGTVPGQASPEESSDLEIEYLRKTLAPGDDEWATDLADALLRRGTAQDRAQAVALLRKASERSPDAARQLADCMLSGCPTPDPDPAEAQRLLGSAALAGNYTALEQLASPPPANPATQGQLPDAQLGPADRFAWSQLLTTLVARGCYGPAEYARYAWGRYPAPDSTTLSPADAVLAAQKVEDLTANLPSLVRTLGCD